MPEIKRVNAVFIYVVDMPLMRQFYEKTLGLGTPIVETDMWVEYEMEGANLALHQGDEKVLSKANPTYNTVKFSLETDDIAQFCSELMAKGVMFTFEPRKDFGSMLAEFKDPESNLIRLIQFI